MTKKAIVSDQVPVVTETPLEIIQATLSAVEHVEHLPIDHLLISPDEVRKTVDPVALQELAASIREHGVLESLIVRPLRAVVVELEDGSEIESPPMSREKQSEFLLMEGVVRTEVDDTWYEIVAGQRRRDASILANKTSCPCIVREMTDDEAREARLTSNLQRVDVPPLEEADEFAAQLDRLHSIAAVATKFGKEQSYVAQRLKLRTLTAWSREALREKLITIDHALLLCRLADDEQNAGLKWCLDHNAGMKKSVDKVIGEIVERRRDRAAKLEEDPDEYSYYRHHDFEPQSVVRLKAHISEDSGIPLERAPWPLDSDHLGVDAPTCETCDKNTKANAPLFSDLDFAESRCTDGACFKEKTVAFVRIQARVSEGVQTPLRVSFKSTSTAPRMEKDGSGPNPAQTFKEGQWLEAKKKCEYTRPAVTVDWSDANNRGYMGRDEELRKPGTILQVCIEPKCKTHKKDYLKPKASANSQPGESWEARQKREQTELEEFTKTEGPVRRALYDAILAKISADHMKRAVLGVIRDSLSICRGSGSKVDNWGATNKEAKRLIDSAKGIDLDRLLFHSTFGSELRISHGDIGDKNKGREKLLELAKIAGVDAAAIERNFDAPKMGAPKSAAKPDQKASAKKASAKKPTKPKAKPAAKKAAAKPKKAGR